MRRLAHAAARHRPRPPWRRRTASAAASNTAGDGNTGGSGGDAPVSREVTSFFNKIVGALSSASGAQREKGPAAAAAATVEAAASNFPINIRPGWSFCGEIHIVDGSTSPADERRALRRLLEDAATSPLVPDAAGCIGVDTETKVLKNSFNERTKYHHPTTLLQLSARNTCVIYRLSDIRENGLLGGSAVSTQLAALLGDYKIVKVGCGVLYDMGDLAWEERGLPRVESVVELNTMASSVPSLKRKNMWGLKSLAEKLVPTRGCVEKKKSITVSDWSLPLSHDHIRYAATDAWLGVELAHLVMEHMELEKTKRIQSGSNNNDNSLEEPSNHDHAIMMKDLQTINIFEKPGSKRRAILSAVRNSRAKSIRKPKSHFSQNKLKHRHQRDQRDQLQLSGLERFINRYSNRRGAPHDWCTLFAVSSGAERYKIHHTVNHYDGFFSFSYVSSEDEAQRRITGKHSKSIVILRPDYGAVDSLTETLDLVSEFSQNVRSTGEEEKISVPVLAEDMWPGGWLSQRRYPVPEAACRHVSECLIHYKANSQKVYRGRQEAVRSGWHIQCKRNADDPLLMDLWAQCGTPEGLDGD
jgi:ribonuclease D